MTQLGIKALNLADQFGVEAELEDRFCFCISRELAVRYLVRPAAESSSCLGLLDPQQYVSPPSPLAAHKGGLNDHRYAVAHGRYRSLAGRVVSALREVQNREPPRPKIIYISPFMFKSPLLEDSEMGVIPGRLCNLPLRQSEVESGQMVA